jgi:hypothetical protein
VFVIQRCSCCSVAAACSVAEVGWRLGSLLSQADPAGHSGASAACVGCTLPLSNSRQAGRPCRGGGLKPATRAASGCGCGAFGCCGIE